jgi:Protein of unknown function (DUF2793)
MSNSLHLDLPYLEAAQAQKHITHNEALRALDALVMLTVLDRDLTAPPGSPIEGARYIVKPVGTGAFAGHNHAIAHFIDGAWTFHAPQLGWLCYVADENLFAIWNGVAWATALDSFGAVMAKLGILTSPDSTNRLAVKSDGALFSHDDVTPGSGHMRITINKSAAASDAGFVFQDAFGSRALFGLLGDDNFTLKVSPDSSTFYSAWVIDRNNGNTGFQRPFGIHNGPEVLTIASDAIAITKSYAVVQSETGTADNLSTINGGFDGCLLVISGTAGHNVTIKDGTGNLKLAGDFVMNNFDDTITLIKRGSDWLELCRSNNG